MSAVASLARSASRVEVSWLRWFEPLRSAPQAVRPAPQAVQGKRFGMPRGRLAEQ